MKICIIYHSESGNTRHVAQHLATACNGSLVEVCDRASYLPLARFLTWCKKARGEEKTPIEPVSIDVTGYDILVFGSPVWAFRPTPVIHAAIDSLKGSERKKAVAFSTSGGTPGKTGEMFRKWIEARGMTFAGAMDIHQNDIENEKRNQGLLSLVTSITSGGT
jgi:flavodoxin